ncbi:MAG: BRCT domain-containing protein [Cyanobacteria bacterium J06650_10]
MARLEAELATLTQEKEQLATEKQAGQQNAEAKVAELNEQVIALTAQIKTLENALAAETLKQSESQQRVAELEGQLSTLSESYAKDSGSADAQTQLLKGERDRAQQSAEAAKATIAALQAELKEKDTELSAAEKQAQFRLGALEKDLGTQLQQLTQERTSLQDAKSTAEELVKTLQVEMAALNEQNVAFADAAKKADSGKTENRALQQQIASLIQEGSELTQKLTTAEKTIVELQQTSQKLTADKAALEEAMKISQQVIVSLQSAADNSPAGKSLESKSKKSKAKKATDKAETDKAATDKAATDKVKTDSAPSSPSDATVKETTESKPKADSETTSGALSGKIFVITGTLHEITYEQIAERVTVEGGRINKMPSSKTDYIVVGENPGNKLKKAEKCNVPQLTEAQLLELFASL